MIPIKVRTKTEVAEREIRQFAERRTSFALDHLRDLRRMTVSIEDVNGPKGGIDKCCRIIAEFGFASIVMEETESNWQLAAARALHRLARKASERLQEANRASRRSGGRNFGISKCSGQRSSDLNENLPEAS